MTRVEKLKERTGLTEDQLREMVRDVMKQYLTIDLDPDTQNEVSTSAGAPGYMTPKAVDGPGQNHKSFRKKNGEQFGLKTIRDLEEKPKIHENAYNQYKNSEGTVKQKIGTSIRNINKSLNEMDALLKMNLKLKKEQAGSDLWKRTGNHLTKIEARLVHMANKVRELKS